MSIIFKNYESLHCIPVTYSIICQLWASQVALGVKSLPANAGDKTFRFDPWIWKIPWRRAWQPTPVFLPRDSHGQRLVGYSS